MCIDTSYIAIQTLSETTHGSYRCAPSSDVEKGPSGRSADLVGDDIVGGVDEGLFVAGRDGRASGDVVSAAVAAD